MNETKVNIMTTQYSLSYTQALEAVEKERVMVQGNGFANGVVLVFGKINGKSTSHIMDFQASGDLRHIEKDEMILRSQKFRIVVDENDAMRGCLL